jgi:hypothetical protein
MAEEDEEPYANGVTTEQRVLRLLTIQPSDLAMWTRLCRKVDKQVAEAHPAWPPLGDMRLLSYVKRLLPEIRTMIRGIDGNAGDGPKV